MVALFGVCESPPAASLSVDLWSVQALFPCCPPPMTVDEFFMDLNFVQLRFCQLLIQNDNMYLLSFPCDMEAALNCHLAGFLHTCTTRCQRWAKSHYIRINVLEWARCQIGEILPMTRPTRAWESQRMWRPFLYTSRSKRQTNEHITPILAVATALAFPEKNRIELFWS